MNADLRRLELGVIVGATAVAVTHAGVTSTVLGALGGLFGAFVWVVIRRAYHWRQSR